MESDAPEPTNDQDYDLQETDCNFVEMPLSLFQLAQIRPLIEASKRNRKGLLFMSCAPDPPNAWRMQIVGLSQRGVQKIRKIIAQEVGEKP